jgi:hypothetical protein
LSAIGIYRQLRENLGSFIARISGEFPQYPATAPRKPLHLDSGIEMQHSLWP